MENIDLRPVNDGIPSLNRLRYWKITALLAGQTDMEGLKNYTALECLVVAAYNDVPINFKITPQDAQDIAARYQLFLVTAGFPNMLYSGDPLKRKKVSSERFLPQPMSMKQARNFLCYVRTATAGIPNVVVDDLDEYMEYVYRVAAQNKAYAFDALGEGVVTDYSADYMGVIWKMERMGDKSNALILNTIFNGWGFSLSYVTYPRRNKNGYYVISDDTPTQATIIPVEAMIDYVPNQPEIDEFEFPSYATDQIEHLRSIDSVNYRTALTEMKIVSTCESPIVETSYGVAAVKLFSMLRVIARYYGKSVVNYMDSLRALDICAYPNEMSRLMVNCGATVCTHTTHFESYGPAARHYPSTIPAWLNECMILADNTMLDSISPPAVDDFEYDLVVCDGYSFNEDNTHLFLAQLFAASKKIKPGGTIIIKYVHDLARTFRLKPPTEKAPELYAPKKIFPYKVCDMFYFFRHFMFHKPIGSGRHNKERYLILLGHISVNSLPARLSVDRLVNEYRKFERAIYDANKRDLAGFDPKASKVDIRFPSALRDAILTKMRYEVNPPIYDGVRYERHIARSLRVGLPDIPAAIVSYTSPKGANSIYYDNNAYPFDNVSMIRSVVVRPNYKAAVLHIVMHKVMSAANPPSVVVSDMLSNYGLVDHFYSITRHDSGQWSCLLTWRGNNVARCDITNDLINCSSVGRSANSEAIACENAYLHFIEQCAGIKMVWDLPELISHLTAQGLY